LHSLRNGTEKLATCSLYYLFLILVQINVIFVRILFIEILVIKHNKNISNVKKFKKQTYAGNIGNDFSFTDLIN
jgi:hypothetical protein